MDGREKKRWPDGGSNLLPCDGEVWYYGRVWDEEKAERWWRELREKVAWEHDEVVMFGRRVRTARRVAWYADEGMGYRYSGVLKEGKPWTGAPAEIRGEVEACTGRRYHSCLLNLYEDGGQGMGWHADDEKDLEEDGPIASVSFGAERRFLFRHRRTGEKIELRLESGSLLLMAGETQKHWVHQLPKMAGVKEPRINLTFRRMRAGG